MTVLFPIVPALAQEQTQIEALSEEGTFLIKVGWTPNDLGSDHTFTFTFIEPETESVLEDIQYDFAVLKGEDDQLLRRVDQVSVEQKVRFDETGPHTIAIQDIEGLGEDASFTIEVTPEFPLGALIPVAAATLIALFALRGKSLFSQWRN
jgi:hypothetical protein